MNLFFLLAVTILSRSPQALAWANAAQELQPSEREALARYQVSGAGGNSLDLGPRAAKFVHTSSAKSNLDAAHPGFHSGEQAEQAGVYPSQRGSTGATEESTLPSSSSPSRSPAPKPVHLMVMHLMDSAGEVLTLTPKFHPKGLVYDAGIVSTAFLLLFPRLYPYPSFDNVTITVNCTVECPVSSLAGQGFVVGLVDYGYTTVLLSLHGGHNVGGSFVPYLNTTYSVIILVRDPTSEPPQKTDEQDGGGERTQAHPLSANSEAGGLTRTEGDSLPKAADAEEDGSLAKHTHKHAHLATLTLVDASGEEVPLAPPFHPNQLDYQAHPEHTAYLLLARALPPVHTYDNVTIEVNCSADCMVLGLAEGQFRIQPNSEGSTLIMLKLSGGHYINDTYVPFKNTTYTLTVSGVSGGGWVHFSTAELWVAAVVILGGLAGAVISIASRNGWVERSRSLTDQWLSRNTNESPQSFSDKEAGGVYQPLRGEAT